MAEGHGDHGRSGGIDGPSAHVEVIHVHDPQGGVVSESGERNVLGGGVPKFEIVKEAEVEIGSRGIRDPRGEKGSDGVLRQHGHSLFSHGSHLAEAGEAAVPANTGAVEGDTW